MEIQVDLRGLKRKRLAEIVGKHLSAEPVYKGPPSYAFEVGTITVARHGSLIVPEGISTDTLNIMVDELREQGFGVEWDAEVTEKTTAVEVDSETAAEHDPDPVADVEETTHSPTREADAKEETTQKVEAEAEPATEVADASMVETDADAEPTAEDEPKPEADYGFTIQLPLAGFDPPKLDNLCRLIDSKANLIRKAMGVSRLNVRITPETVDFPWFDRVLSPAEISAYTNFLVLLSEMAKRQSRVIAVEREVENEKYAFRCFLLRINMMGAEYADTRRILLQNLVGNGSMKSGEKKLPEVNAKPMSHVTVEHDPKALCPPDTEVSQAPDAQAETAAGQGDTAPPEKMGAAFLRKLTNTLKLW